MRTAEGIIGGSLDLFEHGHHGAASILEALWATLERCREQAGGRVRGGAGRGPQPAQAADGVARQLDFDAPRLPAALPLPPIPLPLLPLLQPAAPPPPAPAPPALAVPPNAALPPLAPALQPIVSPTSKRRRMYERSLQEVNVSILKSVGQEESADPAVTDALAAMGDRVVDGQLALPHAAKLLVIHVARTRAGSGSGRGGGT